MLQTFISSVQSVSILLLLTATGYFCSAKGWLTAPAKSFINKFLVVIAIPFMCIYALRSRLTIELLKQANILLLIPFFCILSTLLIGCLLGKLLSLPRATLGVFIVNCGISNTLFIGYPMCLQLFGEDSIPYVMTYYMVSTCFTQIVAVSIMKWAGGNAGFSFDFAKKIIRTPAILGTLVGIALVLLQIQPPQLLMSYGSYMNNLSMPLAMLVTGEIIYEIGIRKLKIDVKVALVLLMRFLIAPGICFALCRAFGVDELAKGVFIIQAAMPTLSQSTVFASEYGADENFAAQCNSISTLASFVVIPALMMVL